MKNDLDSALARLDDYVRGAELEPEYEEDLFERALEGRAPELAFRSTLEETFRAMNARGTLALWRTAREVEELVASGLRVLRYDFDFANPVPPDLTGDFDILVTKVPVDLRGIRRCEVEVVSLDGRLLKKMPDVAFDPDDGALFMCCEAELARTAAPAKAVTRLFGVDDSGRRLLVEYVAT